MMKQKKAANIWLVIQTACPWKAEKEKNFKLPYIESLDFKSQLFNSMSEAFPNRCSNCHFIWKAEHLIFYLSADSATLFEILLKDQVLQWWLW